MSPRISIIIPLYNKAQHIKATLDSVWDQTFTDFEVIVVNDGSTDDSLDIVNAVEEERLRVYTTGNKGVSHARNFGIDKAKAELIAFLDADDLWYKHHLQDLMSLYEAFPNCGMYCKAYEKNYFNSKTVEAKYYEIQKPFNGILDNFFKHNLIDGIAWTSSLAIPKLVFSKYGCFDETLRSGQDTELWIRLAVEMPVAFSTKISAQRVFSKQTNHLSMSSSKSHRIEILQRFKNEELQNSDLKKYMDYNRFSVALESKLNNDIENYQNSIKDLDFGNLNLKQKILLKMPRPLLFLLKKFQKVLLKNNVYISAFR